MARTLSKLRTVATLVLIGVGVGVAWTVTSHQDRLLLNRSERICSIRWPDQGVLSISGRQPLILRPTGRGDGYEVTRAGSSSKFRVFNSRQSAMLRGAIAGRGTLPPESAISPDDRWLAWQAFPNWIVASFDGRHSFHWRNSSSTYADLVAWNPNGKEVIAFAESTHGSDLYLSKAVIRSVDNPDVTRQVAIQQLPDCRLAGVTSGMTAIFAQLGAPLQTVDHVDLLTVDLSVAKSLARSTRIRLPNPSQAYDVSLSPDGQHLAWLLATRDQASWPVVQRVMQRLGMWDSHARTGLWITDRFGNGFNEIGHLHIKSRATRLTTIKWTSDNRGIAFVYEGALFVTRVP